MLKIPDFWQINSPKIFFLPLWFFYKMEFLDVFVPLKRGEFCPNYNFIMKVTLVVETPFQFWTQSLIWKIQVTLPRSIFSFNWIFGQNMEFRNGVKSFFKGVNFVSITLLKMKLTPSYWDTFPILNPRAWSEKFKSPYQATLSTPPSLQIEISVHSIKFNYIKKMDSHQPLWNEMRI